MSKALTPCRLFHSHLLPRIWLPMLKPSSDTVQLQPGITLLWSMMCKKRSCKKSCWGLSSPCLQALFKLKPSPFALAWAILQLCLSLAMYLADLGPDSLDWPETCFITVNLSGNHWTVGWRDDSHWTCSAFLAQVLCPLSASTSPLPALLSHLPSACEAAIAHCSLTTSSLL